MLAAPAGDVQETVCSSPSTKRRREPSGAACVRLKWACRGGTSADRAKGDTVVLESFEVVPVSEQQLPEQPPPGSQMSIAAASLLAGFVLGHASWAAMSQQHGLVVTATVPLCDRAREREALLPISPALVQIMNADGA